MGGRVSDATLSIRGGQYPRRHLVSGVGKISVVTLCTSGGQSNWNLGRHIGIGVGSVSWTKR